MPDANPTTSRRDNSQEKARKQAYYQANRERTQEEKTARRSGNLEKHRARERAYCEANRDAIRKRARAYYAANKCRYFRSRSGESMASTGPDSMP